MTMTICIRLYGKIINNCTTRFSDDISSIKLYSHCKFCTIMKANHFEVQINDHDHMYTFIRQNNQYFIVQHVLAMTFYDDTALWYNIARSLLNNNSKV